MQSQATNEQAWQEPGRYGVRAGGGGVLGVGVGGSKDEKL